MNMVSCLLLVSPNFQTFSVFKCLCSTGEKKKEGKKLEKEKEKKKAEI